MTSRYAPRIDVGFLGFTFHPGPPAPDGWFADLEKLELTDEARPLIMKEKVLRVLGLRGDR